MTTVFDKPKSLVDITAEKPFHYCPGCTHGIIHRIIAEVMDELDICGKTISVSPVGCAVFAYKYFSSDNIQAPHGRAPAVATGLKRALPDSVVFTYQGDGDLAAIGTAEIIHAAARGENITTVFVNNAIYGMTGGQMAPTTLIGQKSTTTPFGRDAKLAGVPLQVCEMFATIGGTAYAERVSTDNVKNVLAAKKALKKAFEYQMAGKGFTLVEILANCPTNWGCSVEESIKWMQSDLIPAYPLGVYKDVDAKGGAK